MTPRVFGIGFQKTGTTSLARALEHLGYRVRGAVGVRDPEIRRTARDQAFALLDEYDAFQDNPWPVLFRELDERCPGSRFILTIRSADAWIASMVRHFGTKHSPMREWIYGAGCPEGHEEAYVARYEQHNADVLAYFADRADDLLVMRIPEDVGWESLCGFVDRPVPTAPFPHANKAGTRVARRVRRAIGRMISRVTGRIPGD